jgi:alkaline phosphatase D
LAPDISRRELIVAGGAGVVAVMLGTGAIATDRAYAQTPVDGDLYTLGVASGDPQPDGVVLWTRLAPDPLAPDGHGGMPATPVRVRWEVARDERFRHVVRRGQVTAVPDLAHAVHPEVRGLKADTEYYYRFEALGQVSPVGRTRTAPKAGHNVASVALALVGCQNYGAGFYTAYGHVAQEDVDFVLHTGDYIYETGFPNGARGVALPSTMSGETLDLARYRTQYGLYKADEDLKAAHAAHPWVVFWDDHEVENNYADLIPQAARDLATFPERRAEAYQAYYEHQPLRFQQFPQKDGSLQLYRRLEWGSLLGLNVVDGRQYRSDQTTPDHYDDPDRTMLGFTQERWLREQFRQSRTRWNMLGNQTVVSWIDTDVGPGVTQSDDNWNGYHAARNRLLQGVAQDRIRNFVVVTGDAHCAMAGSLREQVERFDDSPVIGAEFLGTSISSAGDGSAMPAKGSEWLTNNPDMKFFDGRRGYATITIDRRALTTTYKALDYVTRAGAPLQTLGSFTVLDGVPGVQGDRVTQPGPLNASPAPSGAQSSQ